MSFSLVNILHREEFDVKKIWNVVKDTRKSFLSENNDYECENDIILSDLHIIENVEKVHLELVIERNSEPFENVTDETSKIGFEMFTYLNFCPSKISTFYKDLIFEGSSKEIILSTANIIKRRRNAEKETAIKIWNMIDEQLENLNYRKIESVTMGRKNNYGNCTYSTCNENLEALGLFLPKIEYFMHLKRVLFRKPRFTKSNKPPCPYPY